MEVDDINVKDRKYFRNEKKNTSGNTSTAIAQTYLKTRNTK